MGKKMNTYYWVEFYMKFVIGNVTPKRCSYYISTQTTSVRHCCTTVTTKMHLAVM